MNYPEIKSLENQSLELEQFREMDYFAVNNFHLPIELMMENAGLQLARVIANSAQPSSSIKIGVGNGNNGGGGLVAARRLAAWGYSVFLDTLSEINKELPSLQLKRALKFGAQLKEPKHIDVWVDAYLGFSQRLPLPEVLNKRIEKANALSVQRISLDIPTGFLGDLSQIYFNADTIVTLAAPKKILHHLKPSTEILIADLGIPKEVYAHFNYPFPPFHSSSILKLSR